MKTEKDEKTLFGTADRNPFESTIFGEPAKRSDLTPEEWAQYCLTRGTFKLPCHVCAHNLLITRMPYMGFKDARWNARNCSVCNTILRRAYAKAGGVQKLSSALRAQLAKDERLAK